MVWMDPNSPQNNPPPDQNENGIAGKPLYPSAKASGNVLETFQAANAVPTPPKKESPGAAVEALHRNSPLQNIRTYESDVAELMKNKSGSVSKIFTAQQNKKQDNRLSEIRRLQSEEEARRKKQSDNLIAEQRKAEKVVAEHIMQPQHIPGKAEHPNIPLPDFVPETPQAQIRHLSSEPGVIPSIPSEDSFGERAV